MTDGAQDIDFDRLLKLRLVVGRHGEMDAAGWWNTQGLLSDRGAVVISRGFPSTHFFVQARIVFAVARSRCHDLFDPPGCMTLWNLPAEIEDQFEDHWQEWLDEGAKWIPIFEQLKSVSGDDLIGALKRFDLVSTAQIESVSKLRRSAENPAVPLIKIHRPTDDVLALLAAGFSLGERGNPAIPYARMED